MYFSKLIIFLFLNFGNKNPRLQLSVENISSIRGSINVAVFEKGDFFLKKGKAYKNYSIKVTGTTATIIIDDLPKGNYAISLYHDKNSDGICNLNSFGFPKEPYGFSNNFKPQFSPPDFNDCKFALLKDTHLHIRLLK